MHSTADVEQWGVFELELAGPDRGNPFEEVELAAQFTHKHRSITVDGFYDGDGVYRVRFMPDTPGRWSYRTRSNSQALSDREGSFNCAAAVSACNHGPVRVANIYHFAYADGTPYKQIGTTCYAWTHQGDQLEEQTLATLGESPFNKLRMCVFPKSYDFNRNEPEFYPFPLLARGSSEPIRFWEETPRGWSFDWSRFEPAFFRHLEQRVGDLQKLGIEADIILFHPYDRWGFIRMDAATDDRYLRYVVARLAAYRNVWWSMANEWDLARNKTMADWDRYFRIVQESDPYDHLRSIHHCFVMYDHSKRWVTHQSIQHSDLAQVSVWREQHKKPVVVDECCYEGNIPHRWGNITGEEMVRRFWEGTVQGGYVGHGDTFLDPQDILWWARGGVLHGKSAPRLSFLRRILEEGPAAGLDPLPNRTVIPYFFPCAGQEHQYYLTYFGVHRPARMRLDVPEAEHYRAEIVDTWEMTVIPVTEPLVRGGWVDLPDKPYLALILRRAG
jgi:Domain of unknown function (DUF5060)/Domain of unknown function (DUF5605)/Protein of unknown function (DUF4038)